MTQFKFASVFALLLLSACKLQIPRFDGVTPSPSPSPSQNTRAPQGLVYPSPLRFQVGVSVGTILPTLASGQRVTYSVQPALPSGLGFDPMTGGISGTPSAALFPAGVYRVLATNAWGSTAFELRIEVQGQGPVSLRYSSPVALIQGQAMTPLAPVYSGPSDVTYSVQPALPAGLSLNASSGVISGTPSAILSDSVYTIRVANAFGAQSFALTLGVRVPAPSALMYSSPAVASVGMAFSLTPSVSGGGALTYSVTPALPAGLSIQASSGVISGTPTAMSAQATYVVRASNATGAVSFNLVLSVASAQALNLRYTSPSVLVRGVAATVQPTLTGASPGVATTYSVAPSLPGGLALNSSSGVISGTPTSALAASGFVVTARNGSASANFTLVLEIREPAPAGLRYNTPILATVGQALTPQVPSSTGGAIASYTVSPSLPAGLMLNATTGVLSGTPTASQPSTTYTITASNATGSTNFALSIQVRARAPETLAYSSPAAAVQGAPFTLSPMVTGGAPTQFTVTPTLPAGLALNAQTGVISGIASAPSAQRSYAMTAQNESGTASFNLLLSVNAPPTTPSSVDAFVQSQTRAFLQSCFACHSGAWGANDLATAHTAALANVSFMNPANSRLVVRLDGHGGAPTDPARRSDLTARITEWARLLSATPPAGLAYPSPQALTRGLAMDPISPQVMGSVSSYSVSPALPAGLQLNATTGLISGTPTTATALRTYTVSATNSSGSVTFALLLEVREPAPATLSYASPAVFLQGSSGITLSPVLTGGTPSSFQVAPQLPTGLSLNSTTGVISGAPTQISAEQAYVITAQNAQGQASFSLRLEVRGAQALALTYPSPQILTREQAIPGAGLLPTLVGGTPGAVTQYQALSALPAGLALSASSGAITGTPSVVLAPSSFVIRATQGSRQAEFALSLEIRERAPSALSYNGGNPLLLTQGTPMTALSPSLQGGTLVTFRVSPALPAGLSLDPVTGVLSGTPSAASASSIYVIYAENSGGSVSANVVLSVAAGVPAPVDGSALARTFVQSGLREYLVLRCGICHGFQDPPLTNSNLETAAAAAWSRVDAASPQSSILYRGGALIPGANRVSGGDNHSRLGDLTAAPNAQDRAEILAKMNAWIQLYAAEQPSGPASGTARVRTNYELYYGFKAVTGVNPGHPTQAVSGVDTQYLVGGDPASAVNVSLASSYFKAKPRLPKTGEAAGVSGITLGAVVNMMGAGCLQFVEAERALPRGATAGRKAFRLLDFQQGPAHANNSESNRRAAIEKLFELFIQRQASAAEVQIVLDGMNEYLTAAGASAGTQSAHTARIAQIACTIVSSSAEALVHK